MPRLLKEKSFKYSKYLQGAELVGSEGFPKIKPTQSIPEDVISFNEWMANGHPEKHWVDHFVDDYRFNCVYRNCDRYLERYRKAKGVIGTDFSAYRNMPAYRRKDSVGKNRELDFYLQRNGIDVIPVVSYAYPRDFEWCLDGLPPNSSVAISTNGSMQNFVSHEMFIGGAIEVQKRLHPSHLIIAGGPVPELDALFDNIVYYPNFSQRLSMRRRKNG